MNEKQIYRDKYVGILLVKRQFWVSFGCNPARSHPGDDVISVNIDVGELNRALFDLMTNPMPVPDLE